MDKASFAHVTHSQAGTVSVIDIVANSVTAEIPVSGNATGIAGTPDGKRVYVTNFFDAVAVLDAAIRGVVMEVAMPGPIAIAMAPDGGRAYIAGRDAFATTLSVLDTATNQVTLAHAGRSGRRVVSGFIATAFAQDDARQASAQWRRVADQLRPKVPKLAALMDEAETDSLP